MHRLIAICQFNREHSLTVCADCEPEKIEPDELTWALITLSTVTAIFLFICFCRCWPRLTSLWRHGPVVSAEVSRTGSNVDRTSRVAASGQSTISGQQTMTTGQFSKCSQKSSVGLHLGSRSSLRIPMKTVVQPMQRSSAQAQTQNYHRQEEGIERRRDVNYPVMREELGTKTEREYEVTGRGRRERSDEREGRRKVVFDYPVDWKGRPIPYPSESSIPMIPDPRVIIFPPKDQV